MEPWEHSWERNHPPTHQFIKKCSHCWPWLGKSLPSPFFPWWKCRGINRFSEGGWWGWTGKCDFIHMMTMCCTCPQPQQACCLACPQSLAPPLPGRAPCEHHQLCSSQSGFVWRHAVHTTEILVSQTLSTLLMPTELLPWEGYCYLGRGSVCTWVYCEVSSNPLFRDDVFEILDILAAFFFFLAFCLHGCTCLILYHWLKMFSVIHSLNKSKSSCHYSQKMFFK